jgi:hypothetical protein
MPLVAVLQAFKACRRKMQIAPTVLYCFLYTYFWGSFYPDDAGAAGRARCSRSTSGPLLLVSISIPCVSVSSPFVFLEMGAMC